MAWMLYGANGFTGARVAELAVTRGERPVLGGRSEAKLAPLARRLGLEHRVADLADGSGLEAALDGIDVVAHCAGPFSATAAPMVAACLATGTHYLDITGEIDVFEAIYAHAERAREAGVVLLPGAGFDVVPTDCVAARLGRAMPDAVRLELAFKATADVGPGTVKTAIEGAGAGGRERACGRVCPVRPGHRRTTARFPSADRQVTSIPWGDVASAYRTTGIPNIVTYTALPGGALLGAAQRLFAPVLRLPAVQRAAKALVDRALSGREAAGSGGHAEVWGRVEDAAGRSIQATLTAPGAIPLTADAMLRAVGKLQAGGVEPGAHTPSTAFGPDFALECDGVTAAEVTEAR